MTVESYLICPEKHPNHTFECYFALSTFEQKFVIAMATADSEAKEPDSDINNGSDVGVLKSTQNDKSLSTEFSASTLKGDDTVSQNEPAIEPVMDPEKAPSPGPMHPSQFPDGGTQAWLTILGGFCALFVSFGKCSCYKVRLPGH